MPASADPADATTFLAGLLAVAPEAIVGVSAWSRSHSSGWAVMVRDGPVARRYFVKRMATAERQARLTRRADELFGDDPAYVPLHPRLVRDAGVVITRDAGLPSLQYMLAGGGLLRGPLRWQRRLEGAIRLSGGWLRRLHAPGATAGSPRPALERYLAPRTVMMELLPPGQAAALRRAVAGCPDGPLVLTHSDFNPENVLTDGRRLTAIDFGIAEWDEMSPHWDLAMFVLSLQVAARFNRRSPLYWLPGLAERLQRQFLSAYGASEAPRTHVYLVCAAIRHFQLYAKWLAVHPTAARWHLRQGQECLAQTAAVAAPAAAPLPEGVATPAVGGGGPA